MCVANRGTVYLFPKLNITEGSDALAGYNYKWLLSRNIRLNHTCSIMSFTPALYSGPTRPAIEGPNDWLHEICNQ